MTDTPNPAVLPDARARLQYAVDEADRMESDGAMVKTEDIRALLATPPASDAAVHIARLEAALEWALDQAASEHPHYPERTTPRTAYNAWQYPYLMSGSVQGGVGHASFQTALEAVEAARKETRS